ncbi:cytochrome P450 6d3-like [Anopheles maculipalpis]|uniref:cytochrome P450 6d3-like n=1 Tax=Anopheles maculipalpis TaxID=1496333 RepID=UPI0021596BCA|nr:cytochrome P450 6d3-like [Anopheles maculipalpis]
MFVYTLGLFAVALYLGLRYVYTYWARHGLAHLRPEIPYGNLRALAEKRESFGVAVNALYDRSTERLVGVYLFFRPAILVRDAHLAKRIMVADFQHFYDRGVFCDEHRDPLSANLFALPGTRWKRLRAKLTPTFTSGQLRQMMPTFLEVSKKLFHQLEPLAVEGRVVDVRDIASRYVLDVIASVFFGFEANCLHDPDDPFLRALEDINNPNSFVNNIRSAGVFVCPGLLKFSGLSSLPPGIRRFAMEVVTRQIEHRERNPQERRKDFMQLLIDLRREADCDDGGLTIEQCAANVFLFYVAGADTSTGVISFTMHELTHNRVAMVKARQEIDAVLERYGGTISYECLAELKYLDLCVKETLRKYPGLPILNRVCTRDYPVPESDVVIRAGTQVIIPLLGISRDEKYFPDAEAYMPERFDEQAPNHDPDAYYPFGVGPRNCIGLRQGIILSKIALVLMLSRFEFEATVPQKVRFEPANVTLMPYGGLPVRIALRAERAKELSAI